MGIGLYSIPEAAKLLTSPTETVKRWIKGYPYETKHGHRFSRPVVRHQVDRLHDDNILTFAELIELRFVALFRELGIAMSVIRDAANYLSRSWDTDYPFTLERLDTDGAKIFGTMKAAEGTEGYPHRFVSALHNQQLAFPTLLRPYLQKIEYEDEVAKQYWPLGKDNRIVLDPARSFGKPIDDETSIRTFVLYQAARGGEEYEDIASWYGVPIAAIEKAVEYEQLLRVA